MSDGEPKAEKKPVCTFLKRKRPMGGIRSVKKTRESSEGSSDETETSTVARFDRKRRENPLIQSSFAARKKKIKSQDEGGSDGSEPEDAVAVSYKARTKKEGPSDMGATATIEIDTEHDRDARAIFERSRQTNEELKGEPDDKLYRGMSNYGKFKDVKDQARGNAGSKNVSLGPVRAPQNIRATVRWDYQPDICKDYKETGFCGFGDSCKFLHDRSDYKHGWQIERELEEDRYGADDDDAKRYEIDSDGSDDDLPFKCVLCRKSFKDPVMTRCNHYFCEKCALGQYKKSQRCFACGAQTGGVFNPAKKLIEKMKNNPPSSDEEGSDREQEEEDKTLEEVGEKSDSD